MGTPDRNIPMAQVKIGRDEIRAVTQVLRSGRLRAGRVVEDFENRFARAVGARFAVAVNSGTAALHLAYTALLEPGDEIIVPDFTFVATASMALAVGARPVFADVDPETFTIDPKEVARCITKRTRAIAPVHLYGHPAPVAEMLRQAHRHRLRIIWDAAQAHGARFQGRDVGSFRDVVCYSFYPSKNMTTGEGGMLATSDPHLADTLRLLRSHGEKERYQHVRLGYNYRLTDIAAALGGAQLSKLAGAVRRRQQNARILSHGLADLPGIQTPQVAPDAGHAFNLYTILLDSKRLGMSRDQFRTALARRGIETAVHYPLPLHRQPIFRGSGRDRDFPVSTRLAKCVVSLPVHPQLRRQDLLRIIQGIREVVASKSGA